MALLMSSNAKDIAAQFRKLAEDEFRRGNAAALSTMRQASTETKQDWRAQITGAGLGNRLANTARSNAYQNEAKPSIGAWSLVWSKAPKITAAHEQGALIRSRDGFWLAIPTDAAGPRAKGGAKITPEGWEKRNGRVLRFVYRKGRTALLVDTGKKAPGNVMVSRRARSGGNKLSEPRTFVNRSVAVFVLVPQAKLRKKYDLIAAADRIAATLPGRLAAAWGD